MASIIRVPPTGAPGAVSGAAPVYTDNSPWTLIAPGTQVGGATYTGRVAVPRELSPVIVPQIIGRQISKATGTGLAESTQLVQDYFQKTGAYPDLTPLGLRTGVPDDAGWLQGVVTQARADYGTPAWGTEGGLQGLGDMTPGEIGAPGALGSPGGLLQAGTLGGLSIMTWLILSGIGLVLFLVYGKKGR